MPAVDGAPGVVISDALMADLASSRPAAAGTAAEFDDSTATPLPKPVPPPAETPMAVRATRNDDEREREVEGAGHVDDEVDAPQSTTRLKLFAGVAFAAGVVAIVLAFGRGAKTEKTSTPNAASGAAAATASTAPAAPTTPAPTVAAEPAAAPTGEPAVPTAPAPRSTEAPAPEPAAAPVAAAPNAPAPATTPAPEEPKAAAAPTAPAPTAAEPPKAEPAPGDYAALLSEGRALYTKGQTKKALAVLERAVSVKADGDEALVLLANCHLDRGANQKALQAASMAATANPNNADAYLVIGTVQQSLEHVAEARTAYQTYLKLAPKGQYASEVRSILSSLK
jgi:hypothetical protein